MRLQGFCVSDAPPIDQCDVPRLSDLVVVAGPNGVGKTQLVNYILGAFRSPNNPNVTLTIEPTTSEERDFITNHQSNSDKPFVISNTAVGQEFLSTFLTANRRRHYFRSGVLYYESNRSIQNVQPLAFQFEFADPFEELVSWDVPMQPLASRYWDTQHAIFKKIHQQTGAIATRARSLQAKGQKHMKLEFQNPLAPFQAVFRSLLGPKELLRADLQSQQLMYSDGGTELAITSLSSGEREVVNIAFDFLLRSPSDCIIFFDEPELHLHPELLSRLVTTLRSIGERNQFIFVSHSPELVSSSLDDTVVLLTPRRENHSNQAVKLTKDDESYEALRSIGQSIGVVSLGKRIVLIEGEESSLDKATYSELIRGRFDDLVLLPSGGRENLEMFSKVSDTILTKTVWGIDFFMVTDRDTMPIRAGTRSRIKTLPRYHLENYFLDPHILANCFSTMELDDSWLRDADKILAALNEIAVETLPYATALVVSRRLRFSVGNLSVMPSLNNAKTAADLRDLFRHRIGEEVERISTAVDALLVERELDATFTALEAQLGGSKMEWLKDLPGKPIFSKFAARAGIEKGRLKTMYMAEARRCDFAPFKDIIAIFASFSGSTGDTSSGPISLRKGKLKAGLRKGLPIKRKSH